MIYELSESYYPDDDEVVLLESDVEYNYQQLQELVNEVFYPEEDDEDYVDEHTFRNVHQIARVLVNEYDFEYVVADVSVVI